MVLRLRDITLRVYNVYSSETGHLNLEEMFAQAALTPTFTAGDLNCHHPILDFTSCTNIDGRHLGKVLSHTPDVSQLNNSKVTHIRGWVLDLSFISAPLFLMEHNSPGAPTPQTYRRQQGTHSGSSNPQGWRGSDRHAKRKLRPTPPSPSSRSPLASRPTSTLLRVLTASHTA